MNMPKPTPDHRRLEKLAGIWQGVETMHPSPWDPKGGEARGINRGSVALDGFAVILDYEQTRGGERTFAGHGVYTWDSQAKEVVLHWFDSMGHGREEFRGVWAAERLVLVSSHTKGHTRLAYDFSHAGRMSSSMEMSQDGSNWKTLFEADYERS